MLSLALPASLDDCLATVAADGICIGFSWAVVRYQIGNAPSYAIRDEHGQALAIGGFWPWPEEREVWSVIAPQAAPRLREVIALARLTLLDVSHGDTRPVIAATRSAAGARIARLLGFAEAGNGLFVWRRDDRDDRAAVRRRIRPRVE